MSVSLNPSVQLAFNRPFTETVKRTLTVTNTNSQPVAFKVKTTAPKLYCVRPNSGRIEPGESVEVAVLLQPMKEDPPLSFKCRDKFLVQSTFITPEKETRSLHDLWTTVEGDESTKIHQQKLKVAFLPPEGAGFDEEADRSHPSGFDESRFESVRTYDTVRQQPSSNGYGGAVPPPPRSIPIFDRSPPTPPPPPAHVPPPHRSSSPLDYIIAQEETHHEETYEVAPTEDSRPTPANVTVELHEPSPPASPSRDTAAFATATTGGSVTPDVVASLRSQNAEAQAEIMRLRTLLAAVPDPAPSIRRRSGPLSDDGSIAPTDDGTATIAPEHVIPPAEGVSPQMVVAIAFAVFFVTYLFF